MYNANTAIVIPQNSVGLVITVSSGGYVMGQTADDVFTPYTAHLLLQPEANGATVSLPLTVVSGGLTATYTTVGGEFSVASFYTAQLKVTNASDPDLLLYSIAYSQQFSIQAVLG